MASLSRQRTSQPSIASSSNGVSATRPSHQSLARRLLFPNHSGDLPPLLASPNVPPELQMELYDFIALALRAYVNPWWTKITRYDKDFLPQISSILTAVIRALETRALALDFPSLVYQDIPMIVTQHYRDYRNASSKLSSSYAMGGAASLPQLFHQLQPHIALSADGKIDPEYYRQILDHVLKVCLPPEDYAPEAERFIIREVIMKVLLNDVVPRVTAPWFIQKSILELLGAEEDSPFKLSQTQTQTMASTFSLHNFVVMILSALQSFSSTCLALIHAYKQAMSTIKLVNQSPAQSPRAAPSSLPPSQLPKSSGEHVDPLKHAHPKPRTAHLPGSVSPTPSTTSSISYPSRSLFPSHGNSVDQFGPNDQSISSTSAPLSPPCYSDYVSPLLALFSEIFLVNDRLAAMTLMTLISITSACLTPFLDKLLPHILFTTLSPGSILNVVRLSKRTLFPNGYPGPPAVDPSLEEQAEIRERLGNWKGKGVFSNLSPLLFGAGASTVSTAIDPLNSQPCNVHLFVLLLDRVLVGLFPELVGDIASAPTSANRDPRHQSCHNNSSIDGGGSVAIDCTQTC